MKRITAFNKFKAFWIWVYICVTKLVCLFCLIVNPIKPVQHVFVKIEALESHIPILGLLHTRLLKLCFHDINLLSSYKRQTDVHWTLVAQEIGIRKRHGTWFLYHLWECTHNVPKLNWRIFRCVSYSLLHLTLQLVFYLKLWEDISCDADHSGRAV
jgi:hypothetical protein